MSATNNTIETGTIPTLVFRPLKAIHRLSLAHPYFETANIQGGKGLEMNQAKYQAERIMYLLQVAAAYPQESDPFASLQADLNSQKELPEVKDCDPLIIAYHTFTDPETITQFMDHYLISTAVLNGWNIYLTIGVVGNNLRNFSSEIEFPERWTTALDKFAETWKIDEVK